jgi:hypothetical protein
MIPEAPNGLNDYGEGLRIVAETMQEIVQEVVKSVVPLADTGFDHLTLIAGAPGNDQTKPTALCLLVIGEGLSPILYEELKRFLESPELQAKLKPAGVDFSDKVTSVVELKPEGGSHGVDPSRN